MAEDMLPWNQQPWPMWEPHWLVDDSVESMCKTLGGMADQGGPPLSSRKLQLFTVACVRRVQRVFKDERNRRFIDTVEELADGLITREEEMRRWGQLADPPNQDAPPDTNDPNYPYEDNPVDCAAEALGFAGNPVNEHGAYTSARWASLAADDRDAEARVQVSLLRDIFGNPFRPVAVDPSWLAWNDGTVVKLARAIYDQRAFDRLPILADALEGAGCTNADILGHCRSEGPHVRGCWVVDLILGKQ